MPRKTLVPKGATENDYARLAAILDGEGYVGYRNANGNPGPNIEVSMSHRGTLEWLQTTFGGNLGKPRAQHSMNAKECSKWESTIAAMRVFLPKVRPYSITKQVQIDLLLEWLELRDVTSPKYKGAGSRFRQEEILCQLKILNRRGVIPSQGAKNAV